MDLNKWSADFLEIKVAAATSGKWFWVDKGIMWNPLEDRNQLWLCEQKIREMELDYAYSIKLTDILSGDSELLHNREFLYATPQQKLEAMKRAIGDK